MLDGWILDMYCQAEESETEMISRWEREAELAEEAEANGEV